VALYSYIHSHTRLHVVVKHRRNSLHVAGLLSAKKSVMKRFACVRSSGLTSVICGWTSLRHHTHRHPPPHLFSSNLERSHPVQFHEPPALSCCLHGQAAKLTPTGEVRTAWAQRSPLDLSSKYFPMFQQGNSRTFPTESLAHDSGHNLVRAEYGYPKGPPNTNS
jgi:hypothetical protein